MLFCALAPRCFKTTLFLNSILQKTQNLKLIVLEQGTEKSDERGKKPMAEAITSRNSIK